LVKTQYDELKVKLRIPDDVEDRNPAVGNSDDDGDFFRDLEGDCSQTNKMKSPAMKG
jgi:hypothetical protein